MRTATLMFYAVTTFLLGAIASAVLSGYRPASDGVLGLFALLAMVLTFAVPVMFLLVALLGRDRRD